MKSYRRPDASSPTSEFGFTLLEMLVSIALLVALLALAIPAATRAYKQSQTVKCLGNLRAYGNAVLAFHADRGSLPKWDGLDAANTVTGKANWAEWLIPHYLTEEKLRCPAKPTFEDKGFHYAANSGLCIFYPSLKGIPAPLSKVVLAKEASGYTEGFWSATHFNMTVWGNKTGVPNQSEGNAHTPQYHGSPEKRGLTLFFLDGHSEVVAAPGNDWKKGKSPVYGSYTNGGLVYDRDQLGEMSRGTWQLKP